MRNSPITWITEVSAKYVAKAQLIRDFVHTAAAFLSANQY
jgi:hypothetical protein